MFQSGQATESAGAYLSQASKLDQTTKHDVSVLNGPGPELGQPTKHDVPVSNGPGPELGQPTKHVVLLRSLVVSCDMYTTTRRYDSNSKRCILLFNY